MKNKNMKFLAANRRFIEQQSKYIYLFLTKYNKPDVVMDMLNDVNNMTPDEIFNFYYPLYEKYKDTDPEKALCKEYEEKVTATVSYLIKLYERVPDTTLFGYIKDSGLEYKVITPIQYFKMFGPCIFDKGITGLDFFDKRHPDFYILKTYLFNLCLDVPKLQIFVKKCIKLEKSVNKKTIFSTKIVPTLMLQIPHIIHLIDYICHNYDNYENITNDDLDTLNIYNKYKNFAYKLRHGNYYNNLFNIYRKIANIYLSTYEYAHNLYSTIKETQDDVDIFFDNIKRSKRCKKFNPTYDRVMEVYAPTLTLLEYDSLVKLCDIYTYLGNRFYKSYNTQSMHLIAAYNACSAIIGKNNKCLGNSIFIHKDGVKSLIQMYHNKGAYISNNPKNLKTVSFDKIEFKEKNIDSYGEYELLALFSSKPESYLKQLLIRYNSIEDAELETEYTDAILNYLNIIDNRYRSPKHIGKINNVLINSLSINKYDKIKSYLSDSIKQKILIYQIKNS